ncbi:MAG: DCC1-like thiol-disulfide oxidoreductase family protein [Acidimicrobiales bacterium]
MNDQLRAVLLYDGDCALCTSIAERGKRLKLDVEFEPLQSVDLAALGVDPRRAEREVPFRNRNGAVVYGHRAIAAALSTGSPSWRVIGRALTFGPMNVVSEWCYRAASRHRRHLPGGCKRCKTGDRVE